MDSSLFIGVLAFTTTLAATAFAYYSKVKIDEKVESANKREAVPAMGRGD
ncbi:MAG: hypothetical protein V7661_07180 [Sulfitobacter sp.]